MDAIQTPAGQTVTGQDAVLLGMVQGLTEYLPVSSSGHLTLAQHLIGLQEPVILFDIVLHLGTLAAVAWFYRASLVDTVRQTIEGAAAVRSGSTIAQAMEKSEGFRMTALVFLAMIPTGVVGLTMKKWFEAMFEAPALVGVALLVTATFLFLTRYARAKGTGLMEMSVAAALVVGMAQGLAVAPGISRSGATIAAAMFMGVERETAARFSFILSIPAVLAALTLKLREDTGSVPLPSMGIGFAVSAVVGYFCLALLVYLIRQGKFSWFSYYCAAVGAAAIYHFA